MKLSVVINTKNAADTLHKCLESVSFADEILVVDMHSIDKTKEVAIKHKARFLLHDDLGYVEPARNFAVSQATHDMVLVLDADEIISDTLKEKIIEILKEENPADVYLIPRQNLVFGQWVQHTGWWPDYQARLFKKGMVSWSETIHQPPIMSGKVFKLSPSPSLALIHHNYPTVFSYLDRLNRYTSVQASHSLRGFSHEVTETELIGSFFSEFFRRLFVFSGYKDNVAGVGLSFLQATYELVVKLKKWEQQDQPTRKTEDFEIIFALEKVRDDMNYWLADWRVKNTKGLKQFYWKIRRKLRI